MKKRNFLDFMDWMRKIKNQHIAATLNSNKKYMSLYNRFYNAENKPITLKTNSKINFLPAVKKIKIRVVQESLNPIFDLPISQN